MLRQLTYRSARNAFLFSALWLLIGAITLWSPIPGALGIASGFFAAWLVLLFATLGVAGAVLTAAALNQAYPPGAPANGRRVVRARPRPRDAAIWAPRPGPRDGAGARREG